MPPLSRRKPPRNQHEPKRAQELRAPEANGGPEYWRSLEELADRGSECIGPLLQRLVENDGAL